MRKISFVLIITILVGLGLFGGLPVTNASAPTLSVYSAGSDSVQITVNGDPNASVVLYYYQTNYSYTQSQYIGSTNYSGYFSTTVSSPFYNISSGSSVYVVVNNQQSQSVSWPYVYSNYYGHGESISLNQSNVSVGIGQSTTVTISGGNMPYGMYPNSPNLYQAVIGENTLTLTGQNIGSDSLKICSSNSTTSCATLYITINNNSGYNYNNLISLSQNNISLNVGGSNSISIYGNGGYYVSNNSNSNIATANINGSTLNVYGVSYGSSGITVCQSNGSQCAILYVAIGYGSSSGTSGGPAITFSRTNPSLAVGQSISVSIYGGTGSNYNLAYNSNANLVQANLNGSTLTIAGSNNGYATVVVCSAANNCGALTVNIGSVLGAQNNWTFCANENGHCSFYDTQLVRYGANGVYYYRTLAGGVSCSNTVFGDPLFGVVKQCTYGGSQ